MTSVGIALHCIALSGLVNMAVREEHSNNTNLDSRSGPDLVFFSGKGKTTSCQQNKRSSHKLLMPRH